jgi:hypothetical protein
LANLETLGDLRLGQASKLTKLPQTMTDMIVNDFRTVR